MYKKDKITLIHGDCMELMANTPDKFYDLCIVDPPYGINVAKMAYTQEEVRLRLLSTNCCYSDLTLESVNSAKKGNMCREDWNKLIIILFKKEALSDYYDEYLNPFIYNPTGEEGDPITQELHCLDDDQVDKLSKDLEILFNSAYISTVK